MRVAAIDCGTNSIRLLVADIEDGVLTDVDRRMEIVRLGEGVDRTGRLSDAALERTFAAAGRYAGIISDTGASAVRFVATSASRDAANAAEFVAGIEEIVGVAPEVLSGLAEADLSFTGAVRSLPDLPAQELVFDIGGGSTEFVLGATGAGAETAISVDMGCVRMTERHLAGDPPSGSELALIERDVEALLDTVGEVIDLASAGCLVGLAGTVTTVSAIAHDLPAYNPALIHGSTITAQQVHQVATMLARLTREQRLAIPSMHPGRADVIVAGSLILDRIVQRSGGLPVVVSEHDILDGIAWSLVEAP